MLIRFSFRYSVDGIIHLFLIVFVKRDSDTDIYRKIYRFFLPILQSKSILEYDPIIKTITQKVICPIGRSELVKNESVKRIRFKYRNSLLFLTLSGTYRLQIIPTMNASKSDSA